MYNNILILGPKCSGKTIFIYTLLKINMKPTITIGADLYCYNSLKKNKMYLWEVGNGLYYNEIINSILIKINTIIIIENKKTTDFINETISFIKNYSIKNIIIIFNLIDNYNIFNEKYIKSLNPNINFNIFYIDCNKYSNVINIFNFIENNILL